MSSTTEHGVGAGTVLLWFVAGVVIGGAAALLLAPKPGSETRRMLAERARQGQEKAEEVARRGREAWNEQKDQIASAVQRGVEAFRSARGTEQA